MLPKNGDENEDGGDEDDSQCDLADGPRGERLDFALGAFAVFLFVPSGEGGEQEEADKGEDNGDDPRDRGVSNEGLRKRRQLKGEAYRR